MGFQWGQRALHLHWGYMTHHKDHAYLLGILRISSNLQLLAALQSHGEWVALLSGLRCSKLVG